MENRRKFVRLMSDVDIVWAEAHHTSGGDGSHKSVAKNIGVGGICVVTPVPLVVSKELSLTLNLSGKTVGPISGVVRWIDEFEIISSKVDKRYEAGVDFLNILKEDRNLISKFVFELLNKNN